ncbi:MAG: tetratricopeptide repeat protein [Bacteroidetes bacterium]|nr:tetratricopeptide repeat protein [Bacteroidota bacterium]MBS1648432.1 tetratricopeptide repeat protein [Bacteroidota bacterium]
MKKITLLLVGAVVAVSVSLGQSLHDGIKMLNSQFKVNSTREVFKKLYDANPKDPQTIYWYGQSLIAGFEVKPSEIAAAKEVYQKALTDGVNDPWIWVGLGHIELLQDGDLNSAKQKFEQAITATTETRGRNKGKPNANILDAIGRANADGSSKQGDPNYGIEKLKQAAAIDLTNPDIDINLGICYLKLGGEYGGEAVKAFQDAIARDPKNALAMYRIGKIYVSQNNPDVFNKYFNDAIAADPAFPDTYLSLFEYYKLKDVSIAKENLDKFIANADKDPHNDMLLADYLYRARRYNESIAKTKEIEAATINNPIPRLNMLYALNYEKLGDSIQAKNYLEKFFANTPPKHVKPNDYEFAVLVFSKFPGNEQVTVGYLEKAIEADTVKANRINYAEHAARILGRAKLYAYQLKWYQKIAEWKGTLNEFDYLNLTYTAYNAADYVQTMSYADKYITAYPDKSNGYLFKVKAAKALDTTTSPGIAIAALEQQNEFFMKEVDKNRKAIFFNLYYELVYFGDKAKDFAKAIEVCDKMIALYPTPGEENDFAVKQKEALTKALNAPQKPNKPGSTQPTKPGK